jgi:hypothetical protein
VVSSPMRTQPWTLVVCLAVFGGFGSSPTARAQEVAPTPTVPGRADFDFFRGVIHNFERGVALELVTPDGKVRWFAAPEKFSVLFQSGQPAEVSAVNRGVQATVTVVDPRQATAPSVVYKVVIADPLKTAEHEIVEGLVVNLSDNDNVIMLKPHTENAATVPVFYNEARTDFVGGDGLNVDEDQLDAGDRILAYVAVQKDGGLLAERIIFLDGSAEPAYLPDLR